MTKYVVITTPSCMMCKLLKSNVENKGISDVTFIPYLSDEGRVLADKFNIRSAGTVIDTEVDKVLDEQEMKKVFFS